MVGKLGLEETGGARPCPQGRRAARVQMDGDIGRDRRRP
jgi:hypothetical protein